MRTVRRALHIMANLTNRSVRGQQNGSPVLTALLFTLSLALICIGGCGQTATPVTSPATGKVNPYFGGPFNTAGTAFGQSLSYFDHAANQVNVSALVNSSTLVPSNVMGGTFSTADTGFLKVTENFATTVNGFTAQNPPLTGAWAVEVPGAGAIGNFLTVTSTGALSAAPVAMAVNNDCPNFAKPASYLYVTVPSASARTHTADYGSVSISTQGSAVTFGTQPYLIGAPAEASFKSTGGCSNTNLGALTAYPLNSFGTAPNIELISIGSTGLLVSSFNTSGGVGSNGAFGGGGGVLGFTQPSAPVDATAVVGTQYNGLVFSPQNRVTETYDITALASSFGNHSATSQACSTLQASLAANNGQGAGTVPVLPSANTVYGGEFLTVTGTGTVNDPTGATGSENCDLAIDLGQQDPTNNGLFPNATIFVGSNFPPYSSTNPWNCQGTTSVCAVSFPAAAVVGKVQGLYVIFVAASGASIPPAQLPDSFGGRVAQPLGIYLFQKAQ